MRTVMVVDDSRFMCDEIAHQLAGSSFEVVCQCRDAEQAVQQYNKLRPDLVLMDVILPGMDGIEATQALLSAWPDAVIVVVSSLAYEDTLVRAKQAGAKEVIFKPFTQQQLLDTLQKYADGTTTALL